MKQLHIPVRVLDNGTLEYFYGGPLPRIAAGTTGELAIPAVAVAEPDVARRLEHGPRLELAARGTTVLVAVDGASAPEPLVRGLRDGAELRCPGHPHAVEVELREPLMLRLRHPRPPVLEHARCRIPLLEHDAESLDDAYRVVLGAVAVGRSIGPGEVERVTYARAGADWRSLQDLGRQLEARYDIRSSTLAASVLEALPSKVAAMLTLCWSESLEPPGRLIESLDAYLAQLEALPDETELLDLDTARELTEMCRGLTVSLGSTPVEDRHRLVQAAVRYLIRETDEEGDTESAVGFFDDAVVVRAVARALEATWR